MSSIIREGLAMLGRALRANSGPAIGLWVFASALVVGYYFAAPVRSMFESLGEFRSSVGPMFPILSTAFFGAVIPGLVEIYMVRGKRSQTLHRMIWISLFWGFKGWEVDMLYRGQALLFGNGTGLEVLAPKVAVDMLVYNPIWAVPSTALFYRWLRRQTGEPELQLFPQRWYREKVLPLLISTWAVWLPAVILVYLMPTPLQLLIQNVALCFWAILLLFMTKDDRSTVSRKGPGANPA